MARKKSSSFTDVEFEFMNILWENDELTPEELRLKLEKNGRTLASGSVRNVLAIMIRKGYVTRRKEGKGYLYKTKVGRNQAQKTILRDLLEKVFGHSKSQLVAALLNGNEADDTELEEMAQLLEKYRGRKK